MDETPALIQDDPSRSTADAALVSATEAEVRDFYQFLADWEQQHFDALQRLYGGVREDFWAEGGFAPF